MANNRNNNKKGSGQAAKGSGPAAILGARAIRYSGVQGGLLFSSHVLHFASQLVVPIYLGPSAFGQYGLLIFLSSSLNILFNLASKQGTLKRVFGISGDDDDDDDGDDDDDDDEEETAAAKGEDRKALGTGVVLTLCVSAIGTTLVVIFAGPISDVLLGGGEDAKNLVVFAGMVGGFAAVFRLSSLVLWLERRPAAHAIVEIVRPLLILGTMIALLSTGGGLQGAIMGNAIGSGVALVIVLLFLRRSIEWTFSFAEAGRIYKKGAPRIPIVASMWTIQNADIFILSRYVDHTALGEYHLASRFGLVVAFLPGGFRMSMRPLRKSLAYKTIQQSYGRAVARGQELAYFVLLCISTELAVTLLSQLVYYHTGPVGFGRAAPIVPLVAAGMMGPSIMRQVNRSVAIPRKKLNFIGCLIVAALLFIASASALAPLIGVRAAPVGMLIAFGATGGYLLFRGQHGEKPVTIPYGNLGVAALLAGVVGYGYSLLNLPSLWMMMVAAVVLFLVYHVALVAGGIVVKRYHRDALKAMVKGAFGRQQAVPFRPRRAIKRLGDADRETLRLAISEGHPIEEIPDALVAGGFELPEGEPGEGATAPINERLVAALRRAGKKGGAPVAMPDDEAGATEHDNRIVAYLFPEEGKTAAQQDAGMRGLLSGGIDGEELLTLESIVKQLKKVPDHAWELRVGNGGSGNGQESGTGRQAVGSSG